MKMAASSEPTYFDRPETWDPAAWNERGGDIERASRVGKWLPGDARSILDVGCGNGVYTNLEEGDRSKIGVDKSRVALEYVVAPRVQAEASRLPFGECAFDAVVSMEMLEHIPEDVYPRVLHEIKRVARQYILVTVPYRENLRHNQVVCPACSQSFHVYSHLRKYDRADLVSLFSPHLSLARLEAIVPTERPAFANMWNLVRVFLHRQGRHFPPGAVCPHCGYSSSKSTTTGERESGKGKGQTSLGRLWPKWSTYRWWMALYHRESQD
jgi:SAM-dependent methyltransferase